MLIAHAIFTVDDPKEFYMSYPDLFYTFASRVIAYLSIPTPLITGRALAKISSQRKEEVLQCIYLMYLSSTHIVRASEP